MNCILNKFFTVEFFPFNSEKNVIPEDSIFEGVTHILSCIPPNKDGNIDDAHDPDYKEFIAKDINLDELNEKISIKTRQYAKRQSTWSRGHMINWHKIDPKSKNPFKKILK